MSNLFVLDIDLYRLGNATSARLANVREQDIQVDSNGFVHPGEDGISVFTLNGIRRKDITGHVHVLPANTTFPFGLRLHKVNDDYFRIVPVDSMLIENYIRALGELSLFCQYAYKKKGVEV